MSAPTKHDTATLPVGVWGEKSNGTLVLWQRFATNAEAQQAVAALARVGCAAKIIVDREEIAR